MICHPVAIRRNMLIETRIASFTISLKSRSAAAKRAHVERIASVTSLGSVEVPTDLVRGECRRITVASHGLDFDRRNSFRL